LTADHMIIGNDEHCGRHQEMSSLALLDRGTGTIACYPTKHHNTSNTVKALQDFTGPRDVVNLIYTDGAKELAAAAMELGWRRNTATPYRPQTNGVAERNVRRILEGTRV
jgi:transposase InsO family protein